jgi:hypothetical protein
VSACCTRPAADQGLIRRARPRRQIRLPSHRGCLTGGHGCRRRRSGDRLRAGQEKHAHQRIHRRRQFAAALTVDIAGKQTSIPLTGAAPHVAEFEKACLQR